MAKEHKDDHHFVRSAMRVMSRLEEIKWSAVKALVVGLTIILFSLIGAGVIEKIKLLMKL